MAISLNTAGSWVAANATTQTVTLPTHATGDMLLVRVGFKHATMPTTVTCGTAGWAKIGEKNSGTTSSSNGGGSVQVAVFWKVAASGAETNPVITFNGGAVAATPSAAVASSYSKAGGENWLTPVGDGGTIAAATSMSATIASHVTAAAGDLIEVAIITNDNTTLTVPTVTQTGITFAAVVESPAAALSSTTSNDIAADGCYRIANSGTSSAAAVVTGTNSVADEGIAWTTRLRVATSAPQLVTPSTATLTTATFAPTVAVTNNQSVTPTTASLTATRFAPTVTATAHQTVTPGVASLATSAFAPTVTASDHQTVTHGAASLATSTFAPTVAASDNQTAVPATASLTTAAFAPTVSTTSHVTVTPATAALEITELAPTVSTPSLVTPATVTLTLTPFAPVVTALDPQLVTPSTAALSLTGFAPSIYAGTTVVADVASLTLTTFAPDVSLTENQLVTPATASLALATFAATVIAPQSVTPATASLLLSAFAPAVNVGNPSDVLVTPDKAEIQLVTYPAIVYNLWGGFDLDVDSVDNMDAVIADPTDDDIHASIVSVAAMRGRITD